MGHSKVNAKDLMFILKEQLNYGRLCSLDRYREQNERVLDMLVKEAIEFAKGAVGIRSMKSVRSSCAGACWIWRSSLLRR